MVERLRADGVRLFRDGVPVDASTIVESRAHGLMFRTLVPAEAIEVHSSFVAERAGSVSAAHLLLSERLGTRPVASTVTGDVEAESDRSSFLLEHLAYVRDALADELGGSIRVEVDP